MYGYVYLTTNLINGKKYIGKHRSELFDNNYIGSGKLLLEAVKKYGKENFSCEILYECESLEELNLKEKEYIAEANAIYDKSYYNLKDGGDGGALPGRILSEEARLNISNALKGHVVSEETKQKISDNNYWKTHMIWNKGIPTSEESKKKNSLSHIGKVRSEESKIKTSNSLKGHVTTEDTRQKISERLINIPKSNLAKENMSKAKAGKKLVSNNITRETLYVKKEDIDSYINNGFHIGRLNK